MGDWSSDVCSSDLRSPSSGFLHPGATSYSKMRISFCSSFRLLFLFLYWWHSVIKEPLCLIASDWFHSQTRFEKKKRRLRRNSEIEQRRKCVNIIFATCNFGIFALIVLFVVLLARHLAVSQVLKADRDEISFEDKLFGVTFTAKGRPRRHKPKRWGHRQHGSLFSTAGIFCQSETAEYNTHTFLSRSRLLIRVSFFHEPIVHEVTYLTICNSKKFLVRRTWIKATKCFYIWPYFKII